MRSARPASRGEIACRPRSRRRRSCRAGSERAASASRRRNSCPGPTVDGHHFPVRCEIEELAAIPTPAWCGAAAAGHQHTASGAGRAAAEVRRKLADVDFALAGLVRDVGNPSSIRRKLALVLVESAGVRTNGTGLRSSPGSTQRSIFPRSRPMRRTGRIEGTVRQATSCWPTGLHCSLIAAIPPRRPRRSRVSDGDCCC